jgi:hypothetical protein
MLIFYIRVPLNINMKVSLNKIVYSVKHGLEYYVDWIGTRNDIVTVFGLLYFAYNSDCRKILCYSIRKLKNSIYDEI